MTIEELKNYRKLTRTIRYWKRELSEAKRASYIRSPQITGMPGSGDLSDPTPERALREAKLMERIERLVTEQQNEAERIIEWIQTIDDPLAQAVFHARYIRDKSWVAVSHLLHNSPENVRQIHSRYLSHLSQDSRLK